MKNKIKKITSAASVATLLLSMTSVGMASKSIDPTIQPIQQPQPTTCIDLRTLPKGEQEVKPITTESKLFIGLIKSAEGNKILVEKLFDIDSNTSKNDVVYIDVSSFAEQEYKEGYIISVFYNDITKKDDDSIEIVPNDLPTVEENREMSIAVPEPLILTGTPKDGDSTFGIGEFEQNQIDNINQDSFFRGKVISQDGDKIIVEPFFDLDTQFNKEDKVYITITNAELNENQSKDVTKDQIITVQYSELKKHGDETEIIANSFTAIDEDQINIFTTTVNDEQGQQPLISPAPQPSEIKMTEVEENRSFFNAVGNFFRGIFTAIGSWF